MWLRLSEFHVHQKHNNHPPTPHCGLNVPLFFLLLLTSHPDDLASLCMPQVVGGGYSMHSSYALVRLGYLNLC